MSAYSVVLQKEVRDNLRDRRAITTALMMPLVGPLTLVAAFFAISHAEEKTRAPHVPVIGRENAPELVQFLEHQGVVVENPPPDPDQAVREQKNDVVLRIPAGFGDHLREGSAAVVEIVCDPSRQDASPTIERVQSLLEGYGHEVGALRLLVRGVDPSIAQAVRVERVIVSTPQAQKALFLGSLPLFMLMACFVCGLYIAIDITAGERERGSLEPLLSNPVSVAQVVLAKISATMIFSVIGVALGVAAFAVVMPSVPFGKIGLDLHLPPRVIGMYAALFLPTTFLAAALQIFVGTLSKNTKTAQATLGLMVMVPMIPGFISTMFPQQPSLAMCAVPTLGESILALRMLRGEDIVPLYWITNAAVDVAVAAVLVYATVRLFGARMLSS
jgi:sodium transport system permease protein